MNAQTEITKLRKRLAQHDGCSRWGTKDMALLKPFPHTPIIELDKTHLDQFENISPPMRDALSIPTGIEGVVVYVCRSAFNDTAKRKDVLRVARGLQWHMTGFEHVLESEDK